MPYITFMESLMDGGVDKKGKKIQPIIKDFTSNSTEKVVDIKVTFPKGKLEEYENDDGGIFKLLKLTTTVSTSNMHLFNKDCKLKKYDNVINIIDDYYVVRMEIYSTRKNYLINEMNNILVKLTNKARFIQGVLDDVIDLRRKNSQDINNMLDEMSFDHILESYDYLIKLPMNSVSRENVEKLLKEKNDVETNLVILQNTTIQDMWLKELDTFDKEYQLYIKNRSKVEITVTKKNTIAKNIIIKKK